MSQIYKNLASGPMPPGIVEEFVIDVGGPVDPLANIIILKGRDTSDNNDNGIRTRNDPSAPNSDPENAIYVELTNRITGTVTSTDASGDELIDFDLGSTPGVFYFWGDVTAFNLTDNTGATYGVAGSFITDGIVATEISTETTENFVQPSMVACIIAFGSIGNDFVLAVQGLPGKTINWSAMFNYRFVS